ncbi:MAG: hypothetical protein ABIX46_13865 [Burkholderiaceae bacterium]
MEFKSLVSKATATVSAVGTMAEGKLIEWMDDYNRATAVLATLGFEVGKFRIAMGVLPEVHTTLTGKVADVRKDRVEALMQAHASEPTTVTLLRGLLLARQVADHVQGALNSVTLHVTLGLPPSVEVELH